MFKTIQDYPIYSVNDQGQIKNNITQRILKNSPSKKNNNYCVVHLSGKTQLVHRLVAQYFCANPNNLFYVDHIDGNRLNNKAENLRFCTQSQNLCNRTSKKVFLKDIYERKGKLVTSYRVQVAINNKKTYSKTFRTLEEAIAARDMVIKQYHGEFANLN